MNREDLIAPELYNLVDEFEKHTNNENKKALIIQHENGETEHYTYAELLKKANQVANVFKKNGLTKGDVILVMVPRSVEAYVTYIGALKAGLVIIPSSELLRAKDIDYRIVHAEAKAVVAFENYIEEFDYVEHLDGLKLFVTGQAKENWISLMELAQTEETRFEPIGTTSSDIAFLAYTSGTTGNPKGAVHTHGGHMHIYVRQQLVGLA